MRAGQGVAKLLFLLLVARMLAAPISARPDAARTSVQGRFYARVCAWPAPRPQRPTWPASEGGMIPALDTASNLLAPAAEGRGPRLLWSGDPADPPCPLPIPVRLSDCPRC